MSIVAKFSVDWSAPLSVQSGRETANAPASPKLLGLEILRFVSALAVLVVHYNHFGKIVGIAPIARHEQPRYELLWPLYDYGQYGVHIFWGISGYIFFWKYAALIHGGAVDAKQFFWLRFSRLYPLHLITLIFVVILQMVHRLLTGANFVGHTNRPADFIRQLFMASHWGSSHTFGFNSPIWSVSAEVAVYAAFYTILRHVAPSRALCVSVIIACLGLQLIGLDWMSIGCAAYFFAGGLAALVPPKSARPAAALLAGLIALAVATGTLGDPQKMPMIMLVAVPCLLILVCREWQALHRLQRHIQFAGNLTYSSYLLHFPLQLLVAVAATASGIHPPVTASWFLGAYLGVTLALSAVSYRWLELPAQRCLRKFVLPRSTIA